MSEDEPLTVRPALIGLDLILSAEDGQPWLLEANCPPSLVGRCEATKWIWQQDFLERFVEPWLDGAPSIALGGGGWRPLLVDSTQGTLGDSTAEKKNPRCKVSK